MTSNNNNEMDLQSKLSQRRLQQHNCHKFVAVLLLLLIATTIAKTTTATESRTTRTIPIKTTTHRRRTRGTKEEEASSTQRRRLQEDNNNNNSNETFYIRCSLEQYYRNLNFGSHVDWWTRGQLEELVTITHQNELPIFSSQAGEDDIYRALIDLDRGSSTDTVRLIYSNSDVPTTPFANPFSWDIEHLWPLDRGTSFLDFAYTDVHHVRPIDSTVLRRKNRLGPFLFGSCLNTTNTTTIMDEDNLQYVCSQPATFETAPDTEHDFNIWLAPEQYRGDIARALMYIDIRYKSLSLQDCDVLLDGSKSTMGYLSEILYWHEQDPPDEQELERNYRACTRWQGNRNPFVDYPQLANQVFGEPQQEEIVLVPTTHTETTLARTYPSCADIEAPQTSTSSLAARPNTCTSLLEPGLVPFFFINSNDPDVVLFYSLTNLPAGVELFLTDLPWDGERFLQTSHDGIVSMVVPEEGIEAGTLFGHGPNAPFNELWDVVDGNFHLETMIEDDGTNSTSTSNTTGSGGGGGDNIFLYCLDSIQQPHFISGISYGGNGFGGGGGFEEDGGDNTTEYLNRYHWMPAGLTVEEYGVHNSALPEALYDGGSLYLINNSNNNLYNSTRSGTVRFLREAFVDPDNWIGFNDQRFELQQQEQEETDEEEVQANNNRKLRWINQKDNFIVIMKPSNGRKIP